MVESDSKSRRDRAGSWRVGCTNTSVQVTLCALSRLTDQHLLLWVNNRRLEKERPGAGRERSAARLKYILRESGRGRFEEAARRRPSWPQVVPSYDVPA